MSKLQNVKDFFAMCKEILFVLLFVFLIGCPEQINSTLVRAGFTEGNIAGMKWQAKLEESKKQVEEANVQVLDLHKQLQNILVSLSDLKHSTSDNHVKAQVDSLSSDVKISENKINLTSKALTQNLNFHNEMIQQVSPMKLRRTGGE